MIDIRGVIYLIQNWRKMVNQTRKNFVGVEKRYGIVVALSPIEELERPNIIAFVNNLSGGQRGKDVIPALCEILGKENVFDLNEMGGPEPGYHPCT